MYKRVLNKIRFLLVLLVNWFNFLEKKIEKGCNFICIKLLYVIKLSWVEKIFVISYFVWIGFC